MSAQGYYRALMNKTDGFDYLYSVEPFTYGLSTARKLKSDYSGNVFTVRRSSDSATQNIGFSDNVTDETSLTSFVGANDGLITTGYDQAENRDWSEADTGKQVPIIESGTLNTINSKPCFSFSNQTRLNQGVVTSEAQPNTIFFVYKQTATGETAKRFFARTGTGGNINDMLIAGGNITIDAPTRVQSYAESTDFVLMSLLLDGSSSVIRKNGVAQTFGNVGTASFQGMCIGRFYDNAVNVPSFSFDLVEAIIYDSDVSSKFAEIEANINNFYSIY